MPKDAVFPVKLESEPRDTFVAEADAVDRPASQIVRGFMREFIERQRREREHDAWFRQQVQEALAEGSGRGRPGRVRGTRELVVGGTPYVVACHLGEEAVMVLRHDARLWLRRVWRAHHVLAGGRGTV